MAEQTALQRYNEQDAICKEQIAIIEPFLKDFSEKHDAGTRFYSDITVLCGPMPFFGTDWFYNTEEGKEVNERFRKNQASIYVIKWAGASVVIDDEINKQRFVAQEKHLVPEDYLGEDDRAFMVWKNQRYYVPMNVALAVRKLYQAQEYRSVIYAAHRHEINCGLNQNQR